MKKLCVAIFSMFCLFEMFIGLSMAVTYQPMSLGNITFSYSTMNVTGIINSTAPSVGYPIWCTNCLAGGGAGTLCTSTGTANFNQFILSTGTVCK